MPAQGTHTLVPSKTGWPIKPLNGMVCRTEPLLMSTLLSVLSPASVTHRFAPSKRMPSGWLNPGANVVVPPFRSFLVTGPVPGPVPRFAVHKLCPSYVMPAGFVPTVRKIASPLSVVALIVVTKMWPCGDEDETTNTSPLTMTICSGERMGFSVQISAPVLMSTLDTLLLSVLETHTVSPSQARNRGFNPVEVANLDPAVLVHHSPRAARAGLA